MTAANLSLRLASPGDARALLEIYAPYVRETIVTFEYEVPTPEEFARRISATLERYPYLVAELDGSAVGYAHAGPFRSRAASVWCSEVSVYVKRGCHRRGVGRALYTKLEELLRLQNVSCMEACISHPNRQSIKFHSDMDFERVARFSKCAWKLGRWVDVVYMQKILHEGDEKPLDFIPFPELGIEKL